MMAIPSGRRIIYMDETSTSLWEHQPRLWFHKRAGSTMLLNPTRGESTTVIGAIFSDVVHPWTQNGLCFYTCRGTTTQTVLEFWHSMWDNGALHTPEQVVIVMVSMLHLRFHFNFLIYIFTKLKDNHTAHHSREVTNFLLQEAGIREICFTPTYSSVLNPIGKS